MDPLFVSSIQDDLDTLLDLSAHLQTKRRRLIRHLLFLCLIISSVILLFTQIALLKWFCGSFLLFSGIATLRNKDGGKKYEKYLEENGGVPRRNLVYIRDDSIHFWNPDTDNRIEMSYESITKICKTKKFLVLFTDDGTSRCINHTNLTGGTLSELETFLLERTKTVKIHKPFDSRILTKILCWVMVMGLVISLLHGQLLFTSEPKEMTARQAALLLADMGIDPPDLVDLPSVENDRPDPYNMELVLYHAGCGEYDYDSFEWYPATSGVYTFDAEFFEVGSMYTQFLQGVEAMSRGELVFENIIEDDSHVDFESGSGYKTVTFAYAGKTYSQHPEMVYDWFDTNFANALAKIVEDSPGEKRLYFYFDGFQMISVFYADAAWAKAFENATGYQLLTKFQ